MLPSLFDPPHPLWVVVVDGLFDKSLQPLHRGLDLCLLVSLIAHGVPQKLTCIGTLGFFCRWRAASFFDGR